MKFKKVNIAKAQIEGLTKQPYYFEHHCYYAWDITFKKASTTAFRNLCFIFVGGTEEEGKILCDKFKKNFNKADISDGDTVDIIFEKGSVIAIGSRTSDLWVDVNDKFKPKHFKDLNIVVKDLKVYW
jgi:hypothetical protein